MTTESYISYKFCSSLAYTYLSHTSLFSKLRKTLLSKGQRRYNRNRFCRIWKQTLHCQIVKLGIVYKPPYCFPPFSILLEKTTSSSFPLKQGGVEKKSPKINAAGSVYGNIYLRFCLNYSIQLDSKTLATF